MNCMKYQEGTRIKFQFNGQNHTGVVDAHEVGGFIIVRDSDIPHHPVVAVRDTKVRPVSTDPVSPGPA